MEYTRIKGVDKPVSRIVLGTSSKPFVRGEPLDSFLDLAVESGVTVFDSARGYGESEKLVGEYVKKRGLQDKILLISKGGMHGLLGNNRVNEKCIRKDLEISLKTLGFDKLDLYFLHRDNEKTPAGKFVELLNSLQKEGKIGAYGLSNWKAFRIKEAIDYAEKHGLTPPVASEVQYSLPVVNRWTWIGCESETGEKHKESRAWYRDSAFPLFAYSPLGNGYLSGKFKANDPTTKRYLSGAAKGIYHCAESEKRLARAEKLAHDLGVSVAEIGIAYVLSGGINAFAVVGASGKTSLLSCIKGEKIKLTESQMRFLEE